MRRIGLSVVLVTALGSSAALADSRSFDVEHLQLATGGGDFFATESAGHLRPWEWRVGVAYRNSESPLVIDYGSHRSALVASRSLLELDGHVELGRWFGIGADLPLAIDGAGGQVSAGAALGDLRLVPRLDFLRRAHVGMALLGGLRVPTGNTDRFLGEGMVVFEPRLALQLTFGRVRAAVNAGVRLRQERQFHGLVVGDEVFASLALAVLPTRWLDLSAELHGDSALSSQLGHVQSSPVEALLGAAASYKGVRLGAAIGVGVVRGFGDPALRALVTLEYRRPAPARLMVARAVTPAKPSLPPPPPPAPDEEAEDAAAAPEMAGDGMVRSEEPDVLIGKGRIELAEPVFFDTNRKRIRSRFHDELRQLARVLARRPELVAVWIEGHADATGPAAFNQRLSRARAEGVARFLRQHGVAGARLVPVGFGEARPLVPSARGLANARNRRVHFYTEDTLPPRAVASGAEKP